MCLKLRGGQLVLGGGLEPPRLTAYAPQTYVSAISPPELVQGREMFNTTYRSRKTDYSVGDELLLIRNQIITRFQRKILGGAEAPSNRLLTAPVPS